MSSLRWPGWAGWTNPPNAYYAFKGPGTIAAQFGVYDWHIRLNDHVFDRYFDGRVDASDAAEFGDRRTLSMDEMANYVEVNRHLPTMKGRSDWNKEGGFALGDLTNQLWATTETQALYLTELNDRIDVLEIMATDRPITGAELARVKQQVMGMSDLNEAQKQALIKDCARRVNATPSSR